MEGLKIRIHPDPVLRKRAKELTSIGDKERELIDSMIKTMHAHQGIGLAAPQIGVSKRIAVVDAGERLLKMVNPEIVSKKGAVSMEEGCLSVSDATVEVKRAENIHVVFADEGNNRRTQTFNGLTARAIQHEIDHLNGRLIIDYLPWYRRILPKRGVRTVKNI